MAITIAGKVGVVGVRLVPGIQQNSDAAKLSAKNNNNDNRYLL